MKVLLTGILDAFVLDMIPRLRQNGCQLSLLSDWTPPAKALPAGVEYYQISPASTRARQLMEAVHFDAVVFFFAYQCEAFDDRLTVTGSMLDALVFMRAQAQLTDVKSFVLITDRRVFGGWQKGLESETPCPDRTDGIFIRAAEESFLKNSFDACKNLLIRVSSLVAPGWDGSFLTHAAQCLETRQPLVFYGSAESPCDFLRAADLAEFLALALDSELSGTVHLTYGDPCTYGETARILSNKLKGLRVEMGTRFRPMPMLRTDALREVTWIPRHNWREELDELLSLATDEKPRRLSLFTRINAFLHSTFGHFLPYLELLLFAAIAYGLTLLTGRDAMFRYLNFWLLYVVLMGSMHGMLPGTLAAVIACAFYTVDWGMAGNDMYLLLYNMDNWLPLSTYLLGGTIFGYMHDNRFQHLHTMRSEMTEKNEETVFLQKLYDRAVQDRDQLEFQVLHSRDSYGRIYSITRELDSMQPEQIFLSTLDIMESTLQNKSIAIYQCRRDSAYARLVLHSSDMADMESSLPMERFPQLESAVKSGVMFANTQLLPDFPSFGVPVMRNDELTAMILLWYVPFENCTLYFKNLLGIITNLVQSALNRALNYVDVSTEMYVQNTHLLTERAFRSSLQVYRDMRLRDTGDFLLLSVHSDTALTPEEYSLRIGKAIRGSDIAGRMDNGAYYVIMTQAQKDNLPLISMRFAEQRLSCRLVPQESETLE